LKIIPILKFHRNFCFFTVSKKIQILKNTTKKKKKQKRKNKRKTKRETNTGPAQPCLWCAAARTGRPRRGKGTPSAEWPIASSAKSYLAHFSWSFFCIGPFLFARCAARPSQSNGRTRSSTSYFCIK
jgi:hypothetical protein